MRGILLADMPVRELRETVSVLNKKKKIQWSKQKCIVWLTARRIHEANVRNMCHILLRVVVGKTREGFPIGLSYVKMSEIAQRHFPRSAINENHFRWYATTLRSTGEMIPVYREKNK